MMAQQQRTINSTIYKPVQTNEELEKQYETHKDKIKSMLSKLNPNVEVPEPKLLLISKAAIKLPQYDHLRSRDKVLPDIPEPAPQLPGYGEDFLSSFPPLAPRLYKKKKRNEEVKLFDFVDSSKAIQGSSDEENEGKLSRSKKKRSKAAIEEEAEANSNEEQPEEEVEEPPAAAAPKSDEEMVEEDVPKPKAKKKAD